MMLSFFNQKVSMQTSKDGQLVDIPVGSKSEVQDPEKVYVGVHWYDRTSGNRLTGSLTAAKFEPQFTKNAKRKTEPLSRSFDDVD